MIVLPKVTEPVAPGRAATANGTGQAAPSELHLRSQVCALFDANTTENWKRHTIRIWDAILPAARCHPRWRANLSKKNKDDIEKVVLVG